MWRGLLGNDAAEMEEEKQKLTRNFWISRVASSILFLILGGAFSCVGLTITPLESCKYPWPAWYIGMAVFWLTHLVIGVCLANADLAMATREASIQVQIALNRSWTAQSTGGIVQAFKMAASGGEDPDMQAYRQLALVRLQDALCFFAWVWIPGGIVMAFLGGGCQKMRSWFWILVLASICAVCAVMCIRDKLLANKDFDAPGEGK
jgi:hypothetical protein